MLLDKSIIYQERSFNDFCFSQDELNRVLYDFYHTINKRNSSEQEVANFFNDVYYLFCNAFLLEYPECQLKDFIDYIKNSQNNSAVYLVLTMLYIIISQNEVLKNAKRVFLSKIKTEIKDNQSDTTSRCLDCIKSTAGKNHPIKIWPKRFDFEFFDNQDWDLLTDGFNGSLVRAIVNQGKDKEEQLKIFSILKNKYIIRREDIIGSKNSLNPLILSSPNDSHSIFSIEEKIKQQSESLFAVQSNNKSTKKRVQIEIKSSIKQKKQKVSYDILITRVKDRLEFLAGYNSSNDKYMSDVDYEHLIQSIGLFISKQEIPKNEKKIHVNCSTAFLRYTFYLLAENLKLKKIQNKLWVKFIRATFDNFEEKGDGKGENEITTYKKFSQEPKNYDES